MVHYDRNAVCDGGREQKDLTEKPPVAAESGEERGLRSRPRPLIDTRA